jgi:hypothetical protein
MSKRRAAEDLAPAVAEPESKLWGALCHTETAHLLLRHLPVADVVREVMDAVDPAWVLSCPVRATSFHCGRNDSIRLHRTCGVQHCDCVPERMEVSITGPHAASIDITQVSLVQFLHQEHVPGEMVINEKQFIVQGRGGFYTQARPNTIGDQAMEATLMVYRLALRLRGG